MHQSGPGVTGLLTPDDGRGRLIMGKVEAANSGLRAGRDKWDSPDFPRAKTTEIPICGKWGNDLPTRSGLAARNSSIPAVESYQVYWYQVRPAA